MIKISKYLKQNIDSWIKKEHKRFKNYLKIYCCICVKNTIPRENKESENKEKIKSDKEMDDDLEYELENQMSLSKNNIEKPRSKAVKYVKFSNFKLNMEISDSRYKFYLNHMICLPCLKKMEGNQFRIDEKNNQAMALDNDSNKLGKNTIKIFCNICYMEHDFILNEVPKELNRKKSVMNNKNNKGNSCNGCNMF